MLTSTPVSSQAVTQQTPSGSRLYSLTGGAADCLPPTAEISDASGLIQGVLLPAWQSAVVGLVIKL